MIDREKVISGLECCTNPGFQPDCKACPYNDNPSDGMCLSLHFMLNDALALLKADYETVPIKPLAKWLAGYAMPPGLKAREIVNNRGRDIHEIAAEEWEAFLRGMDWEEKQ